MLQAGHLSQFGEELSLFLDVLLGLDMKSLSPDFRLSETHFGRDRCSRVGRNATMVQIDGNRLELSFNSSNDHNSATTWSSIIIHLSLDCSTSGAARVRLPKFSPQSWGVFHWHFWSCWDRASSSLGLKRCSRGRSGFHLKKLPWLVSWTAWVAKFRKSSLWRVASDFHIFPLEGWLCSGLSQRSRWRTACTSKWRNSVTTRGVADVNTPFDSSAKEVDHADLLKSQFGLVEGLISNLKIYLMNSQNVLENSGYFSWINKKTQI